MKLNASSEKDMEKLIAKYNQELMRFYQKNKTRMIPEPEEKTTEAEDSPAISAVKAKTSLATETVREVNIPSFNTATMAPATESIPEPTTSSLENAAFAEDEDEMDLPSGMRSMPEALVQEDTPELEYREPEKSVEEFVPEHLEGTEEGTGTPASETGREPTSEEDDETDIGYLQIRVFTARTALPIQNAFVTISKQKKDAEDLIWLALTDRDGVTESLPLPTISRNASQEPSGPIAFSVYNVQVDAAGFYTVHNKNVPIYGGIAAVQPVELIPLPEQSGSGDLVFPESGPAELE